MNLQHFFETLGIPTAALAGQHFLETIGIPIAAMVGSLFALFGIRSVTLRAFQKWIRQTFPRIDESAALVLKTPSFFWCLVLALHVGIRFSDLPEKIAGPLHTIILISLILSVTIAVANVAEALTRFYLLKIDSSIANSGVLHGVLRASLYSMGLLILLSKLDISITPFLTAFGVGGVAVALALKDTLENMFSGIHLLVDRAISVGDSVRLESGHEGKIEDIGWRTTKIRMAPSADLIILPNVKLAQSMVIRLRPRDLS
jgi:small-conductance mechanosensitive channel